MVLQKHCFCVAYGRAVFPPTVKCNYCPAVQFYRLMVSIFLRVRIFFPFPSFLVTSLLQDLLGHFAFVFSLSWKILRDGACVFLLYRRRSLILKIFHCLLVTHFGDSNGAPRDISGLPFGLLWCVKCTELASAACADHLWTGKSAQSVSLNTQRTSCLWIWTICTWSTSSWGRNGGGKNTRDEADTLL